MFIEILSSKLKGEFSLYINYNSKKSNVIYGNDFELVYGKPHYIAEAFGIKYKIGVRSFMQVNNDVCLKLYSTVRDLVDADLHTTVVDAYSGAGLMTALLSVKAKNAYGIEIIEEADKRKFSNVEKSGAKMVYFTHNTSMANKLDFYKNKINVSDVQEIKKYLTL